MMDTAQPTISLENGFNLKDLLVSGSVLQINEDYEEVHSNLEADENESILLDYMGQPVNSFEKLAQTMITIDDKGLVKKKVIEEGGGLHFSEEFTVSIAFSGYWENDAEPFDVVKEDKPLVVDLKDNGLLPGIQIAIKTLLVGELSIFLFSYEVMYGEMGVPPRIKPKANCVFYIKLIKSILTPKLVPINYSESNMFNRVHHEVKLLYSSGITLHKSNNYSAAIQLFRRCVSMLHKCRLADGNEESIQEKLLIKLYTNLAICYNRLKQPLKACIACNELNRLNCLWNNSKVLFQNAKALRMLGQFGDAEKRIKRALTLYPENEEIKEELQLLLNTRDICNKSILTDNRTISVELVNDKFKQEVDNLVQSFKTNVNLCMLTLPCVLNSDEIDYIKEVCKRENLFINKIEKNYLLDKEGISSTINDDEILGKCYLLDNNKENT